MSAQPIPPKLRLAVSLFAIADILLGWYLAAHHIFWLMSAFVILATLILAWKNNPILESMLWFTRQQVFVLLGVSLLFSLSMALFLTQPILLSFVPLPFITLIYVLLEMRTANFSQINILLWCVMTMVLGLCLGEAIDLLIVPSMRY